MREPKGLDPASVRAADDVGRARIWADLVSECGGAEASRQWLAIFAATDAPRTGVLLPNVNATPVTLLSLWAAGHTPAILNFSTGTPVTVRP